MVNLEKKESIVLVYIHAYFTGSAVGPVANCKKEKYSAQPKEDKTFADFVDYWQSYIESDYPESMDNLYLKDWHFTR